MRTDILYKKVGNFGRIIWMKAICYYKENMESNKKKHSGGVLSVCTQMMH
jgi:hypothetical protein